MNFLSMFVGTKWAMRSEDASVLASSRINWSKDDEGYYTAQKSSGELDIRNCIERRDDGIAVIKVDGSLCYRDEDAYFLGLDTYNSIEAAFNEVLEDDSVLGVVFDINSPGGEVSGCADLGNKIFEARGKKPCGIVARTGGMMCSAAYWIGSSCEQVYCADNGTLGSIGVLCTFQKWSNSLVENQVVVSDLSPNKAPTPDTPEGLALIKKELNDLAGVFISTVARNRGVAFEDVMKNFGQGGVFVGEDAVKAGLADGVMSLDALCEQMTKGSVNRFNGGSMATTVKKAEAAPAAEVDMEAIKAQAVADYKARVASVEGVFAGLEISAEDKKNYLDDESKTVADATAFALEKAKETVKAQSEEIAKMKAELEVVKAKAEAAPAADADKLAIQKALEASAAAQNSVEGGVHASEDTERKAIAAAFSRGSNN